MHDYHTAVTPGPVVQLTMPGTHDCSQFRRKGFFQAKVPTAGRKTQGKGVVLRKASAVSESRQPGHSAATSSGPPWAIRAYRGLSVSAVTVCGAICCKSFEAWFEFSYPGSKFSRLASKYSTPG